MTALTKEESLTLLNQKRYQLITRLADLENSESNEAVEESLIQLAYEDAERDLARIENQIELLSGGNNV